MSETLKPCPFCGKIPEIDKKGFVWHGEGSKPLCPFGTHGVHATAWNRRASGWISVKDRLPEERKRVLFGRWQTVILGDYKKTGFSIFPMRLEDGALIDDMGDVEPIADYTHWMPLPPPPEVEE